MDNLHLLDPKLDNVAQGKQHNNFPIGQLIQMIEESSSDKMILKPLNGFGGSGVILIEKSAMGNINSLLDFYISKSDGGSDYVILQEYIEGADKGDVRILILNVIKITIIVQN